VDEEMTEMATEDVSASEDASSTEGAEGDDYPKQDNGSLGQKVSVGSMVTGLLALLFF
jgi:hypothetical protein